MNSPEFKNNVCRICLDENVVLDWTNSLVEYCDITYEECYYKYTQLQPLDDDPFSSMLCQNCLDSLENVHALIVKALDSYNFLLEVNCLNSEMESSVIFEDDVNAVSTDFETILVEKPDAESILRENYEYESFEEISIKSNENDNFKESTNTEEVEFLEIYDIEDTKQDSYTDEALSDTKDISLCRKSKRLKSNRSRSKIIANDICNKKELKASSYHTRHKKDDSNSNKLKNNPPKSRKGKIRQEHIPCMCSFCSKVLHNKYALQKHEKIHIANRERKAACPICGVKFLEESYVKIHMQIHNQNREKKHKCEFCEKAFFEKGSLNVHRRIHLGTMIPCTICSKEFYRKVDLDIHMTSHSDTTISARAKRRSKYYVRCKYCNKNIVSTSFKSHNAVHLNEPLMKCSICNKEFFRRDCCTEHLKSIHKKTSEEYNDYIIIYNKNRLSHLYLEQATDLQVNED